ncbi:MAG TPA: hypothetical protein VMG81_05305 [Thermoplasmata archaeon]|nr:hypothetical protein [Thermoplasmata archaeon]
MSCPLTQPAAESWVSPTAANTGLAPEVLKAATTLGVENEVPPFVDVTSWIWSRPDTEKATARRDPNPSGTMDAEAERMPVAPLPEGLSVTWEESLPVGAKVDACQAFEPEVTRSTLVVFVVSATTDPDTELPKVAQVPPELLEAQSWVEPELDTADTTTLPIVAIASAATGPVTLVTRVGMFHCTGTLEGHWLLVPDQELPVAHPCFTIAAAVPGLYPPDSNQTVPPPPLRLEALIIPKGLAAEGKETSLTWDVGPVELTFAG